MLANLLSQQPKRYVADSGNSLNAGPDAKIQAKTSVLCPYARNLGLSINLCLSCLASKADA